MSRIDITSSGAPLSDGILQTANPLDATLQVVTDNAGNSSKLLLSTDETQINSTLRIQTDNAEILDIENSSGNRFNINRSTQKINLDFASKPTDITTQVGAIRTAIDGTNLADVVKFQENGQVTFTERVKLESDSTVTTQTSSVIQSSTTNANLVIAPNGTGALIAAIPDGTATGGNARGVGTVDLQLARNAADQVGAGPHNVIMGYRNKGVGTFSIAMGESCISNDTATVAMGSGTTAGAQYAVAFGRSNVCNGQQGTISGGQSNQITASAWGTISGGQSNTASTSSHATVVGGNSNTASGQFSIVGGTGNSASGNSSVAFGNSTIASGLYTTAIGNLNNATATASLVHGVRSLGYITAGKSIAAGRFSITGDAQSQETILRNVNSQTFTTGVTTVLGIDVTGTIEATPLIPNGNNRAWNVQVNWVAIVTTITGTATGISVGDVVTSIDLLAFKKIGGVSSASAHTSTATKLMVTTPAAYAACAINYTAGASQEMALTFTGPSFAGGGSVTMRVVARIELTEVAF